MKRYIWIVLIVLLAGFLRFYRLTEVPPALNSDEVAIGYNAYSILKTGRDEYGIRYPLTFRSFDDYKMPVYVYMVSGSMKVFGYNDFAVRFPSAFLGTLTVLVTYLFVRQLFGYWDNKQKTGSNSAYRLLFTVPLLSSFLLAISPWSLQFSRAGYEANVAVFFVVLGAYLFLLGLKKGWVLIVSSLVLSLAIWTYLSTRIFVPLLMLGFAIIYAEELWKKKLAVALSILVGIFLVLPIMRMSLSVQGQMRASGVSAFTNPDDVKKSASRIASDNAKGLGVLTIFDNRRLTYAITFLRGYFSHFDPIFLFLDKSISKYRAPDVGLLYIFELPLLLAGSYMLVRKWNSGSAIVFWWIIVSPVAAAFTPPPPHPVRSLVFLPSFQIIGAVGALALGEAIVRLGRKNKWVVCFAWTGCLSIILLSFLYYTFQYFVHLPVEGARDWYVGRKEMVKKLGSYENQYDRVIISNELDFPYIFFLYYRHVDPVDYLKKGGTVSGGFTEEKNRYGKYEFRSLDTSLRSPVEKVLFVGLPTEVFNKQLIIDHVNYPDGSPAISFFK